MCVFYPNKMLTPYSEVLGRSLIWSPAFSLASQSGGLGVMAEDKLTVALRMCHIAF